MSIQIQQKLHQVHLKVTQARVAVLKVLLDRNEQLTAKQIYQQLYLTQQKVSLSTIYRVVCDLEKSGLIIQKQQGRSDTKYAVPELSDMGALNIQCSALAQVNKESLIESLVHVFQSFNVDVVDIEFSHTSH